MPRVTLIGYRGTGKSTLAATLADALGCGWVDADVALEARLGMTITDLVATRGEPAFRDAESELLAELLTSSDDVVSTGGGVVLRPDNRLTLRERGRPIIWLQAPADLIRRRLASDPTTAARRPALTGRDPLQEVDAALAQRDPLYRELADAIVDTSRSLPAVLTERIVAWLAAGAIAGTTIEDRS